MDNETLKEFTDVINTAHDCSQDEPTELMVVHHQSIKDNATEDYEDVRKNMKIIMNKSVDAFDSLIRVAKDSESPRAFEVVSGYIRSIADVGKTLMELHKEAQNISDTSTEDSDVNAGKVENNYFVGSTEELQELILRKNNPVITPKNEPESE